MEHPFKTILKALGIVICAAIVVFSIPLLVNGFSREEWYLTMAAFGLLAVWMLVQLYTNANRLLLRKKVSIQ